MATRAALKAVLDKFQRVFGKATSQEAAEDWCRAFYDVPDNVLADAGEHLVRHRDKTGCVVPGELARAVEAVGGTMHRIKNSPQFERDPVVKALRSRSGAAELEEPVSLADWLASERLVDDLDAPGAKVEAFRRAMQKYGGRPSATDLTNEVAGLLPPRAEKWKCPGKRAATREASGAKVVDDGESAAGGVTSTTEKQSSSGVRRATD